MPPLEERQRVAAYGLARRANEILLVRASAATGVPGTWWLPGGGLGFGESPTECVAREFVEETGLRARVGQVLDIVSDLTVLVRAPVRLHSVRIVYGVSVEDGSLQAEAEGSTDAVRWVREQELDELPVIPWLRDVLIGRLGRAPDHSTSRGGSSSIHE
jgi:8-oxo-dGTP diphosphatase